jgi:hypothetical protein
MPPVPAGALLQPRATDWPADHPAPSRSPVGKVDLTSWPVPTARGQWALPGLNATAIEGLRAFRGIRRAPKHESSVPDRQPNQYPDLVTPMLPAHHLCFTKGVRACRVTLPRRAAFCHHTMMTEGVGRGGTRARAKFRQFPLDIGSVLGYTILETAYSIPIGVREWQAS